MLATIARNFIRVVQFLGALGTLIAHSGEVTYINMYIALIDNDTADDISTTFVPQVPTVVWFLVSAMSVIASLVIATLAFRRVARITHIERAVAFCMAILWGISIGAVFGLDGQFYTFSDTDSAIDTSQVVHDVETKLVIYIDIARAMSLLSLSGWTFGLLFSLLSDCFADCRNIHDSEKAHLNEWSVGVNVSSPPELSERYGELPHHTSLKSPATLSAPSSNRNSYYKTPMEVATRSVTPLGFNHHEDLSSTHSWESSIPSSPRSPTHGLHTPPLTYTRTSQYTDTFNSRYSYVPPNAGNPEIRIDANTPEDDVSPTSVAYLITNPKPVASLRRANSFS
ncbi:hypothetical protein Unana1_01104 [Umbelopsis nana]